MVEIPAFSYKSLARSINGVIGSLSRLIIFCIKSSRTIKLVADVSSSIKKVRHPASIPSITAAAWEVLPLASSVLKQWVSLRFGKSLINSEISVFRTLLPSSARSFMALSSVMTYSRPSPAT